MNGDISYADAREWCMENDISLGQFDRWLYGALRKSDNHARVEPKEPWPYRVVAGINRVLEILLTRFWRILYEMLSGMLFKSEANCIRNSDHWDKPGNQV